MASSHVTVGSGDHHVVVLHGWFGSARGWGSLPGYLDGSAYTYVFMDMRGCGGRKQTTGEFTMEEAAADAVALANKLGWERFSLIGHSMGGTAVQHVLLQAPRRVRRLVGLNPVPATGVPFDDDGWALFSVRPATVTTGRRLSTSRRGQAAENLHRPDGAALARQLHGRGVRRVPPVGGED